MTGGDGAPSRLRYVDLMVITGRSGERGHLEVAEAALEAGCRAVQVRDKAMSDREFAEVCRLVLKRCRLRGAVMLVNDRVDVAAAVGADGVHLGVEDLGVSDAVKLLPAGALVGFSPEDVEQARGAVSAGADYLGVGPVFASRSKEDAGEPIGLGGVRKYLAEVQAPLIAVGGIDQSNAASVMEAGASGVAVVSAVLGAPDMREAVAGLLERLGREARQEDAPGGD